MDAQSAKQQLVEKVKESNNVLIAVSKDPSVDQLVAALGLTFMLNKMGKHTSAVVSGAIPPAIAFLEPNKTFDDSVDSLRDFVISLSTEKAEKLRYKKEDGVVKIFITPYKTKLSKDDFEFTQGDFNVDVVIALGVGSRNDLDESIRAHGRILHDATVITINNTQPSKLGSIDWTVPEASSLSEMLVSISEAFQGGILDAQMSTAFLTGIVSATDRFRNSKTSPKVMTMAAQLMAAGANQQLVASNLDSSSLVKDPPKKEKEIQLQEEKSAETKSDSKAPSIDELLKAAQDNATEELKKETDEGDDKNDGKSTDFDLDSLNANTDDVLPAAKVSLDNEKTTIEGLEDDLKSLTTDADGKAGAPGVDMLSSGSMNLNENSTGAIDLGSDLHATSKKNVVEPIQQPAAGIPPQPVFPVNNVNQQTAPDDSMPPLESFKRLNTIPNTNPAMPSRGMGPKEGLGSEPSLGGTFNATTKEAADAKARENLMSSNNTILSHNAPPTAQANLTNEPVRMGQGVPKISTNPRPIEPLQIDLDEARRAVEEATNGADPVVANNPIQSLNAQPLSDDQPVPMGPMNNPPQPTASARNGPVFGLSPVSPMQNNVAPPPPAQQMPQMQSPLAPQSGPQQTMAMPTSPPPLSSLAPPPPPPGGSAPTIAPRVSPANLGSFAPAQPPQQQMTPPQPMGQQPSQPGQFGSQPMAPPSPIQFDATPPPGNMPGGQRTY